MDVYKFSKKTSVSLRPVFLHNYLSKDVKLNYEEVLKGYTVDIKAFPFAIVKRTEHKQAYWIIVNRFSGRPFVLRFAKKKTAEKFFNTFSKLYDIFDIEFKDPLSKFDYKIISFEVRRILKQEEYLKNNHGELYEKGCNL